MGDFFEDGPPGPSPPQDLPGSDGPGGLSYEKIACSESLVRTILTYGNQSGRVLYISLYTDRPKKARSFKENGLESWEGYRLFLGKMGGSARQNFFPVGKDAMRFPLSLTSTMVGYIAQK